jgi:endonuclease/exonuclease/phosphatase family metal-dependent hydrolase
LGQGVGPGRASARPDPERPERRGRREAHRDHQPRPALPTLIAGDFNAAPDAASIRYLTGLQSLQGRGVHYHDAWAAAGDGPGYTWTVDNPAARAELDSLAGQPGHRRRLDYAFVGSPDAHPEARSRIRGARLAFERPLDGVWVSDHFGVCVELEVDRP